ncbi:helix-turn-helix transcriptional regulator [Peribacillus simplex]|uniref:Helix-turn-helix transcriptional regulator n=2 Tax=Peribacillus simplex TaxID=1478 RepID=A0A9X8ZK42_9BACI|nr:helix-turn-helix transcriptional regulator [Peribacillus simplex]TKH14776.1 helix-turn-helix transcriptional regulator [Peribacillus simplex]
MVHAWEKGIKKINLENLLKIADLYEVSLDELVGRTPPSISTQDLADILGQHKVFYQGYHYPKTLSKKSSKPSKVTCGTNSGMRMERNIFWCL